MVRWISLDHRWTLQDVQAGLNVSIAVICAGATFTFVRYFWLIAARRVIRQNNVPAYSLLSLNSIGETVDVIFLLRNDLFTRRYFSLLAQCLFVALLTVATLLSGFLARFSTRYGTVVRSLEVNGTLAERMTGDILYAEIDTNRTMQALQNAKWPNTQMLEFLPNAEYDWDYVSEQWNGSWIMDCSYNKSTPIPNVSTHPNCSSITTELPFLFNNFLDWYQTNDSFSWQTQSTDWRANTHEYRDWVVFSHGLRWITQDKILDQYTQLEMRTIMTYLSGVPWNTSVKADGCNFAVGPIRNAYYTSTSCLLTRKTEGRTQAELLYGAYPDGYDVGVVVNAYLEHFGNSIRKESSRDQPVTPVSGEEATHFWLAWQITKDTITSPYVRRTIDVTLQVPQISFICLLVCSILAVLDLFGLITYWLFLLRNWSQLQKTPQSKLDWMLRTLHHSNEIGPVDLHQKLAVATASEYVDADAMPMNRMGKHDVRSLRSDVDSISSLTLDSYQRNDGFDGAISNNGFFHKTPSNTWFPQQYERVNPNVRQN